MGSYYQTCNVDKKPCDTNGNRAGLDTPDPSARGGVYKEYRCSKCGQISADNS